MIWAFKEGIKVYSYKDENYSNVDEQENINKFLKKLMFIYENIRSDNFIV